MAGVTATLTMLSKGLQSDIFVAVCVTILNFNQFLGHFLAQLGVFCASKGTFFIKIFA